MVKRCNFPRFYYLAEAFNPKSSSQLSNLKIIVNIISMTTYYHINALVISPNTLFRPITANHNKQTKRHKASEFSSLKINIIIVFMTINDLIDAWQSSFITSISVMFVSLGGAQWPGGIQPLHRRARMGKIRWAVDHTVYPYLNCCNGLNF